MAVLPELWVEDLVCCMCPSKIYVIRINEPFQTNKTEFEPSSACFNWAQRICLEEINHFFILLFSPFLFNDLWFLVPAKTSREITKYSESGCFQLSWKCFRITKTKTKKGCFCEISDQLCGLKRFRYGKHPLFWLCFWTLHQILNLLRFRNY